MAKAKNKGAAKTGTSKASNKTADMAASTEQPVMAGPSANDRLSFMAIAAVLLHALIILGVGFSYSQRAKAPATLEITLAQHADQTAPEDADFLAQHNQQASGDLDHKAELTTDRRADFADTTIRDANPEPNKRLKTTDNAEDEQIVTTTAKGKHKAQVTPPTPEQEKRVRQIGEDDEDVVSNDEIATLQAKLAQERQAYAKRPRIKTLTSVSARSSVDAEYLNGWQERIEIIGNLNYPQEARRKQLYGELRLLVSLLPDGSVNNIEILQSSGQRVLDDAAIRIVRLSSPFAAFPYELKKDVDQLEIIRTWKFERGNKFSSE